MTNILVCDDDKEIVDAIEIYLKQEGYQIYKAYDGEQAIKMLKEQNIQLLIIDIMMPKLDGIHATLKIREYSSIPIIFLSAKSEDTDKILGLNIGADDYVTKPFNPLELVARVKAHINIHEHLKSQNGCNEAKSNDFETGSIRVANLKIFPLSRQVFCSDREVEMANKEFELLYFLASNPNIVFSKDALFDKIWGMDAIGGTATVAVHINRIREKIGTDKENLKLIETVWGAGYRFRVK